MKKYIIGTLVVLVAFVLGVSAAYGISRIIPTPFINAQNPQFFQGQPGRMGHWGSGNRHGQQGSPNKFPWHRGFPPGQEGPRQPGQNNGAPQGPGMIRPGQPWNNGQPNSRNGFRMGPRNGYPYGMGPGMMNPNNQ